MSNHSLERRPLAVVTGATGGVGSAIAIALSRQGYRLCLVGSRPETFEALSAELNGGHTDVALRTVDLTVDEEVQGLAREVEDRFGGVEVLVHGAAVISSGPLESAPVEELDRQYRVNVRAPYVLTQALLPALRRAKGQIAFVNSSAHFGARPGASQHSATTHALRALTDSLRGEVNEDGVRVVSVYFGTSAGDTQECFDDAEGDEHQRQRVVQPEGVAEAVIDALSTPRTAEVTDVRIRPFVPAIAGIAAGLGESAYPMLQSSLLLV